MGTTTSTINSERSAYKRAGRRIEYISIAWTSLEALVGIVVGLLAGSVALICFAFDSLIEVASSGVLLWRLSDHPAAEEREKLAHRLVGVCFLVLAAYITLEALDDLIRHQPPSVSYVGIVYAGACVVVMPLLARAKRRIAAKLDSAALDADSHQSDICAYLSIILLVGLLLNALLGWWWADPVAALGMVPLIIKEGVSGIRGGACGCHTLPPLK